MYSVRKGCRASFREFVFAVGTAYPERGTPDQSHPSETAINLSALAATESPV